MLIIQRNTTDICRFKPWRSVLAVPLLSVLMLLSGCATTPDVRSRNTGLIDVGREQAAVHKRVLDCALPYMSRYNQAQANINYVSDGHALRLSTVSEGLSVYLQDCVGSEAIVPFSGKVFISSAPAEASGVRL
jgi:hypothetical protein